MRCARVLLFYFVVASAYAQVSTSRLEGVITDQSGAVVPGVKIVAVNNKTQVKLETDSSGQGLYVFPSLPPGEYTVTVEAQGFRKAVRTGVVLNVGETVAENINLEVGSVAESVVVEANALRVQTADAQIARAITLRDIDVLPQLGRGPIILAIFNPGVQINPGDPSFSRVNGTRQGSTNAKLDGVDINDHVVPRLGLSHTANNTDSIEEFRMVTNGGKAEYGRSAGGQIELITRSGTNIFHGNAFEYLRNTALHANNFFNNSSGLSRPKFIQNTFGGSFGGPIRRDRTFIFGNYQGVRTSQQIVRNRTVLTPEAKAGLFRWKPPGSPEIQSFDIVRNDPRRKGIDPKVADILKLLPSPNNYDVGDGLNTAGFRFNNPSGGVNDQMTIKTDHNLWTTNRVFFRWSWFRYSTIDALNSADARFPGQAQGSQGGRRWAYSAGSDWSITNRLVNELRVGYKFNSVDFVRPGRLPGSMLLANSTSWTDPLNPAFPSGRQAPVRQITDNFTIVHGKHTIKGGLDWRFTKQWSYSDAGIWPNITFARTFGNTPPASIGPAGNIASADRQRFESLYNDLLGRMNQVTQTFLSDLEKFQEPGTTRERTFRFREYGYFFQDDWKIIPRLTLNLGLRYEFSGVPHEARRYQGTVDKAALIHHAARLADLTIQRSTRWYNNDFNNFAPRLGFAWDLTGDGKTAIRANWGAFYDRLIGATTSTVDGSTPGFSQAVPVYPNSAAGADARVSDGIPLPERPAAPVLRLPATRSTTVALFVPNLRTGYVQHYSLTVQREIFRNTVLEAGYVGTHGAKMFMDLNLNQPRIYEDFLAAFRELQAFRLRGTPVPASNTLVRIFGSAASAISTIGASVIDQGVAGSAADTVDRTYYARYTTAGVSDFYLRNFPQFNQVIIGVNDGRSYYDSLQLSLRRQAGALKFNANYTFSKSMDNISVDGNGFSSPIDNYNVRLNRARGDADIPHTFTSSLIYTLPIGKGRRLAGDAPRWADLALGGWDIGLLNIWQSGGVITYSSGRATGPTTTNTSVNYTGDRNIGQVMRKGDGVYLLTPEEIGRFSFPNAGEIGAGGRNAFRGPRYFIVDMSLVKKFKITEQHAVSLRAEAYNLFNNVNFGDPGTNFVTTASFGKISGTVGSARIFQMALRYDF
ncbi:MAG: TonB-dependent receptor [Acidobacteriota bacterium]